MFCTEDGAISTPVWDIILYSILEQVPDLQETFYQAYMKNDDSTKAMLHQKFHLESSLILRKHAAATLQEMIELLEKINQHDETEHPAWA